MNPSSIITWPALLDDAYVTIMPLTDIPAGTYVNLPLSIVPNAFRTDIFTGEIVNYYQMPLGNARNVMATQSEDSNANTSINIIGTDPSGNIVTDTLILPASGSEPVQGTTFFATITSASYTGTPAFQPYEIGIGYGSAGYTYWYQADVWNKEANYSISYSQITGDVELNPLYTTNYKSVVNGQLSYTSFETLQNNGELWEIPIENPNVIVSPSSIDEYPITTSCSINVRGIPMQALTTYVPFLGYPEGLFTPNNGSFVQRIMQQGAKF